MLDLSKSNSFKKIAKSKRSELRVLDREIKCIKDDLKMTQMKYKYLFNRTLEL
jgi:hypothetical protein